MYEDFFSYRSGVYIHTSGQPVGGHAIKMLGFVGSLIARLLISLLISIFILRGFYFSISQFNYSNKMRDAGKLSFQEEILFLCVCV